MKLVAINCTQLEVLDVGFPQGRITDETLKLIATNCLQLRSLDVSATKGEVTESIKLAGRNCIYLESLDLSQTDHRRLHLDNRRVDQVGGTQLHPLGVAQRWEHR